MKIIDKFADEYGFLSNFSPHGFICDRGINWKTSEHYYQAQKEERNSIEMKAIMNAATPGKAKRLGKGRGPVNWQDLSIGVMEKAVRYKFDHNPDIKQKLLDTGYAQLVEGNTWGDTFFGQVNGKGKNVLGKILMNLREKYRLEE